jgi:very-short-patch-repair endonuclease
LELTPAPRSVGDGQGRSYPPPHEVWEGVGGGALRRKSLTPLAQELRKDSTNAEKIIWSLLRSKRMGVKFRRQTVMGRYIVDFVCFEKKLVIEVDGGQHCQNPRDVERDHWLRSNGFDVLRIWNNDVLGNLDGVYEKITMSLKTPTPAPPHAKSAGEGKDD